MKWTDPQHGSQKRENFWKSLLWLLAELLGSRTLAGRQECDIRSRAFLTRGNDSSIFFVIFIHFHGLAARGFRAVLPYAIVVQKCKDIYGESELGLFSP